MNLQFTAQMSSLGYIFMKGLICPSREKENSECHKARYWQRHKARSMEMVMWYDGCDTNTH